MHSEKFNGKLFFEVSFLGSSIKDVDTSAIFDETEQSAGIPSGSALKKFKKKVSEIKGGRTNINLHISRLICRELGGDIVFRSQDDERQSFVVLMQCENIQEVNAVTNSLNTQEQTSIKLPSVVQEVTV